MRKAHQDGEDNSSRRRTQRRASAELGTEAGRRRGRPVRQLKESELYLLDQWSLKWGAHNPERECTEKTRTSIYVNLISKNFILMHFIYHKSAE